MIPLIYVQNHVYMYPVAGDALPWLEMSVMSCLQISNNFGTFVISSTDVRFKVLRRSAALCLYYMSVISILYKVHICLQL